MKTLIALLAVAMAGAATAAPVELPVNLEDGASWEIHTARVRTTDDDGKISEIRSESRSQATLRLDGETLVLTLTPMPGYASADLPPELAGFGLDFPLEFEVDEALTPGRLRNWSRLRETLLKFVDSQPAGDPAFVQTVRTAYGSLSDETAANLFAPHLAYLGVGQGLALEVRKPLEYEDQVANPLGGPPIATKGSILLESLDKRAKRAVVVWTHAMDGKSMEASIREVSKAIATQRTDSRAAADSAAYDQMKADRKERCQFEIDTPSGLAIRSECAMTTAMSAPDHHLNRTDTWTIVQTLPKSR